MWSFELFIDIFVLLLISCFLYWDLKKNLFHDFIWMFYLDIF